MLVAVGGSTDGDADGMFNRRHDWSPGWISRQAAGDASLRGARNIAATLRKIAAMFRKWIFV